MQHIAFDVHKKYTLATVESEKGELLSETRLVHERGVFRTFLKTCERGSPVAVETVGNWYWVIDEIEEAGFAPKLVHARRAKVMMGMINKTDKLDNRGMNRLQRTGTLPTVWIPRGEIRDRRELPRTRMVIVRNRTKLKNRVHAMLAKYGLKLEGRTNFFRGKGLEILRERIGELPEHARFATTQMLDEVESLGKKIQDFEDRMKLLFGPSEDLDLVKSLPGIGFILGTVILAEIGVVGRFASAARLASYSGTTPRVHSSGGKTRYGRLRNDVNQYLKWSFMEGANAATIWHKKRPERHVSRLYSRIRSKRNHQKAIGAVARHLAEATWWMLTKKESYLEPNRPDVLSTKG